ncbi:sensor histidine kinase [Blastomonas fulva]|jgi:two-component sensor histidine kinase|uniref:sensor histidine kinase n=1 Tax=Blastomonas fulva TaxID=1550728 RepID=UPI003D2C06C6
MASTPRASFPIFAPLARLSIGTRLFLIMAVALLPLALGAVVANRSLADTATEERNRLLQKNVDDAALRLGAAIQNDLAILSAAASQIALGEDPAKICLNLREQLGPQQTRFAALLYSSTTSPPACQVGAIPQALRQAGGDASTPGALVVPQANGAIFATRGRVSVARALAFYPAESMLQLADPVDDVPLSQFDLRSPQQVLPLTRIPTNWERRLNAVMTAQGDVAGLNLDLRFVRPKQTPPEFLAQIIPFITVLAAAGIGWLVVNFMLIAPLTQLQRKIRQYETGERLVPMARTAFNASEIQDLDQGFVTLAHKVSVDREALDEGLKQQIMLTREVHHRVKNNLQIIASLINLHARTADSDQAKLAYGKIQRRVDALAVVHRNHFAGTERNEGINLRALVGELAGSFEHAGNAAAADGPDIVVDIDNMHVSQDVGVPIAFLLTEILELIHLTRPEAPVRISAKPLADDPTRIKLRIASPALGPNPLLEEMLADGIDRVMTGLARQLRAPLERDTAFESIAIAVPVFVPAKA